MRHVEILGLGHPRTGTGYTSKVLSDWGLDVGHETSGKMGIVSWLLVKPKGPYMWQSGFDRRPTYNHLVYNVRDPKTALASITYTESPPCDRDGYSWDGTQFYTEYERVVKNFNYDSTYFRKQFIGLNNNNPVENAIDSICQFHDMIMNCRPNIKYRIEDEEERLFNYMKIQYPTIKFKPHPNPENTRKHKSFENMCREFPTPSLKHQQRINEYAEENKYEKVKF